MGKYIYTKRTIMRLKIYWWSSIILPGICSLPIVAFGYIWYHTAFQAMTNAIGGEVGVIVAAVISIPILALFVLFTYVPLTVLAGVFDDYQLFTFYKAVQLSGPSKFIFKFTSGDGKGRSTEY